MADEEKTSPKRPDQSRLKVTKEELEASGLSLRDYMNKQLGLKRRDGSAPESAPAKASSSKAGPSATPSAGSQMGPGSSATKDASKSESPKFKMPIVKFFEGIRERGNKGPEERDLKSEPAAKAPAKDMESEKPREDFASIKNMLSDRRARIARDNAALESGMKKGGTVKMAKGGSASSRADGCAQRGKTKGMMR